jgi:hypothetical protein
VRLRRRSSSNPPFKLKTDSEEIVETCIIMISLAKTERIG